MRESRAAAVVTGVFFLVAAVAAVVALALYQPLLGDPGYVLGPGADTRVLWGAFLEVVLAAAVIGTAVTAFPVVERHGRALALGYVAGRLLEAAVITVGIVAVLAVVTLRQDAAGTDGGPLVGVAQGLVALHDATFLVGPGLVIGVNTLLLAALVYRGRLAPRPVAVLGLVGGPLVTLSSTAVLFGVYEQVSVWGMLGAVPVAAWEISLAVYLIARGFRRPAAVLPARSELVPA
ncbi:DUF4386 domain-containing protein [Geodermatophilus nigrescens]|uniref:DUF4386 domain-containing protein n=1 Tax=Geodermatophilus nigrescens TaxID=1070870 RepID=A0A1M5EW07_9ACTN|nr:DUF4386 domain-containing protein [Geodermatophilus nigrescens]SHF83404.1 protein of unknown function [Geodermatophilus nigrescens]